MGTQAKVKGWGRGLEGRADSPSLCGVQWPDQQGPGACAENRKFLPFTRSILQGRALFANREKTDLSMGEECDKDAQFPAEQHDIWGALKTVSMPGFKPQLKNFFLNWSRVGGVPKSIPQVILIYIPELRTFLKAAWNLFWENTGSALLCVTASRSSLGPKTLKEPDPEACVTSETLPRHRVQLQDCCCQSTT